METILPFSNSMFFTFSRISTVNIFSFNIALSDKSEELKIVSTDSCANWAYISECFGKEKINATTLDNFVFENNIKKLDLIKIDVEGFEEKVIRGSKETIKKFFPKQIIAIYHKASDLINIPLLESLRDIIALYVMLV